MEDEKCCKPKANFNEEPWTWRWYQNAADTQDLQNVFMKCPQLFLAISTLYELSCGIVYGWYLLSVRFPSYNSTSDFIWCLLSKKLGVKSDFEPSSGWNNLTNENPDDVCMAAPIDLMQVWFFSRQNTQTTIKKSHSTSSSGGCLFVIIVHYGPK